MNIQYTIEIKENQIKSDYVCKISQTFHNFSKLRILGEFWGRAPLWFEKVILSKVAFPSRSHQSRIGAARWRASLEAIFRPCSRPRPRIQLAALGFRGSRPCPLSKWKACGNFVSSRRVSRSGEAGDMPEPLSYHRLGNNLAASDVFLRIFVVVREVVNFFEHRETALHKKFDIVFSCHSVFDRIINWDDWGIFQGNRQMINANTKSVLCKSLMAYERDTLRVIQGHR